MVDTIIRSQAYKISNKHICLAMKTHTLIQLKCLIIQIVYLTYDDAFSALTESDFYRTLFDGTYTNPDGCAIRFVLKFR